MATKSVFSAMLNQKPTVKGPMKEEKPKSAWVKMLGLKKGKK